MATNKQEQSEEQEIDGIKYKQHDGVFIIDGLRFRGCFLTEYAIYKRINPSKKLLIFFIDKGIQA